MNKKTDLLSIRPDPNQPRSLLPPDLVGLFENGLMAPKAIMREWPKSPNKALTAIIRLADSIAQHGQINPISVQATQSSLPGVKYLIVTGERRWWAHVLLLTQGRLIIEGETRTPADKIKINVVTKGVSIRAHQLIENVVREDLDAVEKAHGMWALRYELSGKNYSSILPTSAQEKYLVGWGEVERSLGVSSRYRQYVTSVLKLTPDALRLVAEYGLSESTIRPITQKLYKHADLQMQALRQLVAWQEDGAKHSLVKEVKQLVESLVAEIPEIGSTPRPSLLPLGVSVKKKAGVSKVGDLTAPAPAPAPDLTAPVPDRSAPVPDRSAPIPDLTAPQLVAPTSYELKSLINHQILRTRPKRATHIHDSDLDAALDHLLSLLEQRDPESILTHHFDKLMTLKHEIGQLLK